MKTNRGYIIASVRCYPSCKHLRKVNFVFLDLTYPGPEASLSGFFSGFSGFLPPKKPTFWIPIQPGNSGQEEPTRGMSNAKWFDPINYYRYCCYFCMSHSFDLLCSQHELLLVFFKFSNFYSDSLLLYFCYVSDSPINNQNGLRGYSLQCNGASTRNIIIISIIIIIIIIIISAVLHILMLWILME